ncbi:hypothetical protein FRB95_007540, partial [Tulasnella sp. JGI-2019a]
MRANKRRNRELASVILTNHSMASAPPDDRDLLMCSLSTIIHYFNPEVPRGTTPENESARKIPGSLDEMALILVTDEFDGAIAVLSSFTRANLNFAVVTMAKNLDRTAQPNVADEFTTSPTPDCGPFNLRTHASHLTDLKLHNAPGEKLAKTAELSQYIYFQCLLKISKRAKAEIAPGISVIKFFALLDLVIIEFSNDPSPPPEGAQQLEERGSTADAVGVRYLTLNKESKRLLVLWITSTIEKLDEQIGRAISATTCVNVPGPKRKEEVTSCLDELVGDMESINALSYSSVAVWDLLHSSEIMQFYESLEAHS